MPSIQEYIDGNSLGLIHLSEQELDVLCPELARLKLTERLKITTVDLSESATTERQLDIIFGWLPRGNEFILRGIEIEGQTWLCLVPQRSIRLDLSNTCIDHLGLSDFLPPLPYLARVS